MVLLLFHFQIAKNNLKKINSENKLLTSSYYYSTSTRPKSHILVENNPVRVNYDQLSQLSTNFITLKKKKKVLTSLLCARIFLLAHLRFRR